MRRTVLTLAVALAPAAAGAHVGSPDAIFEGTAGAYPVRVTVRAPGVIPGLAEVVVRQLGGETAREVTIQPQRWDARGEGGAPPPDVARPVRGETGLWSGSLWIMTPGSYAVRVEMKGAAGAGVATVPVAAAPTRSLAMNGALGALLLVLGGLLVAGAVSIVGAAAREAVVALGLEPDRRRRRHGLVAMTAALVLLALASWGGWRWWAAEDAAYRSGLYRPLRLRSAVRAEGKGRVLRMEVDDDEWRERQHGPLAPDHGKLMHLFLIRDPALDAIAHLHPVPAGRPDVFETPLPALPEGRYRLYADVTHEDGFAQTLVDTVAVAGADVSAPGDPDDSTYVGGPTSDLGGGYTLTLETAGSPVAVARKELALRFRIRDGAGAAMMPEPYMGMLAHAVVTRDDGGVFIHLHPSGTVSMAAQAMFAGPAGTDPHAAHRAPGPDALLSFPYEFPRSGRHRMWVQVKVDGLVRTGAFDLDVTSP